MTYFVYMYKCSAFINQQSLYSVNVSQDKFCFTLSVIVVSVVFGRLEIFFIIILDKNAASTDIV